MLGLLWLLLLALPPRLLVCVEASLKVRLSVDVRRGLFTGERFSGDMRGGTCHSIGGVSERSLTSGVIGRSVVCGAGCVSPLAKSSLRSVASWRLAPEMRWLMPVSGRLIPVEQRLALVSGRLAPMELQLALLSGRLAPVERRLAPESGRLAPVERRLAPEERRLAPVSWWLAPVSERLALVERRLAPVSASSAAIWLVPDGGGDWASLFRRFAVSRWSGVGRVLRLATMTPSSGVVSWRLLTTRRGVMLLYLLEID
ncbi:ribosome binding protein 1-like protein [Lasius niger]|uniref:Ribosome binding protein 1-like protein n=1 Tax=Lasius niger TaxID=67767 RepID=A0A0J7KRU5_LASNI|nr:ribosome binding protein 1-like protein [Lasius niger]